MSSSHEYLLDRYDIKKENEEMLLNSFFSASDVNHTLQNRINPKVFINQISHWIKVLGCCAMRYQLTEWDVFFIYL